MQEIPGTFVILTHEPFYVGKGNGPRSRLWTKTFKSANNQFLKSKILKIQSFGFEPIIKKLSCSSEQQAFDREQYLIRLLGRYDLNKGPLLNHTDGGEGGSGAISSQRKPVLQLDIVSGDIIKRWDSFSEASETTRYRKIFNCLLKNQTQANGYFWCYESEYCESLILQLQTQYKTKVVDKYINRKKYSQPTERVVIQKDLITGEILNSFKNLKEAGELFAGFNNARYTISRCCRNELRSYKGYAWEYLTNNDGK